MTIAVGRFKLEPQQRAGGVCVRRWLAAFGPSALTP